MATSQAETEARGRSLPPARATTESTRRDLDATMDSVRSAADEVGRRVPELIDGASARVADGARLVESWPEPTRRLVASFSIGLGSGLIIAGAPRIVVAGALLPALAVGASTFRREPSRSAG